MALVAALGAILNSPIPPVGIEILPGDPSAWLPECSNNRPFLFEERNLGIPLKAVCRAYLEASHIFSNARKAGLSSVETGDVSLANSTSVLLLANPAHQTALNTRKILVDSGFIDANVELDFTAALLSSHEASKHSTLWHHRRWLLRRSRRNYSENIDEGDDTLSGIALSVGDYRSELSIVSRACERYPRNYFAWNHRYTCVRSLVSSINRLRSNSSHSNLVEVLDEECSWITSWIERHISDYTAMQYACQLSQLLQETSHNDVSSHLTQSPSENVLHSFNFQTLRTHAESLLRAYPDHESLWLYLRSTFQYSGTSIERVEDGSIVRGLILFVRDLSNTAPKGSGQDTSLEDKCGIINLHACRFLSWLARRLNATVGALEGNGRAINCSVDVGILADSLLRTLSTAD
ncbi:hypothetical protein QCA50_005132 [Cerrena zonata]|uniref:Protein prenyltransferase alpha subunit repeat-containing protein 1 n=1 Tax=Cerrena zonata TaxID=2478898 RepID=A0AAW0GGI1_9APHY